MALRSGAAQSLEDYCLRLEKSMHHDIGIAYTWKTIGDLRAKKKNWQFSEDAYDNALTIFNAIDHTEAYEETYRAKMGMMAEREMDKREKRPTAQ